VIPLAISAVGLTSSLGLGSEEGCAAARAGLVRVSSIDTLNTAIDPVFAKETLDGIPTFVGHLAPAIGTGHAGLGKLMALSKPALEEVLRKVNLSSDDLFRTGLCLSVSDGFYQARFGTEPEPLGESEPAGHDAVWNDIASNLGMRLCAAVDLPIGAARQWVSRAGRLGLLGALEQASRWFAAGELDRCLIGTIESCVEPSALLACGAAQVLKTDANPVGFMPGEAAAFLLVEPATAVGSANAPVRVVSMSRAVDAAYLDPDVQPLGRGISDVTAMLAAAAVTIAAGMPPLLITDLNGTEFRASDWGHALVHLRDRLGEFESELWLPVESFGETGAATGGVALCMVFEAARRGHVPGTTALLVLCADGGGRGGLLIETPAAAH
jgi:3-oxoacyl-[acyl-carrier-protein] synthase-1